LIGKGSKRERVVTQSGARFKGAEVVTETGGGPVPKKPQRTKGGERSGEDEMTLGTEGKRITQIHRIERQSQSAVAKGLGVRNEKSAV